MDVRGRLEALPRLSTAQLRTEWNELFGRPVPPKMRRELVIRI